MTTHVVPHGHYVKKNIKCGKGVYISMGDTLNSMEICFILSLRFV